MTISKKTHHIILASMLSLAIIIAGLSHYKYTKLGDKAFNSNGNIVTSNLSCGNDICIGSQICCNSFDKNVCMEKSDCNASTNKWCNEACIKQCNDSIWPTYCESVCATRCYKNNNPK